VVVGRGAVHGVVSSLTSVAFVCFSQNAMVGPVKAGIDSGLFVLCVASMVVLIYQIIAVPLLHRWNLSRCVPDLLAPQIGNHQDNDVQK
jgi:hypothetical protein